MNDRPGLARLDFLGEFDERARVEAQWRGYRSHVVAELDDGTRYPVLFYELGRLEQVLAYNVSVGRPFITRPGLVVLSAVTVENMEKAVRQMCAEGYFEHLKPMDPQSVVTIGVWPPARPDPSGA